MKALVVPAVNGAWKIREVPTPEPGPNQVLIKIHASGLCYTDVHITLGHLPAEFPHTLGHEPVGTIAALGPGVTTRRLGDRVGVPWVQSACGRCEWCARGKPIFCAHSLGTGIQLPGSHAEFMLAYADATMLVPDNIPFEQAAPIFCAGYTVWSGLRIARPQPHERIAVVGIGGLGHLAVQYAKAAGFDTLAVTHSPDKTKLAREFGADEVVADGKALADVGGADVILITTNSWKSANGALHALRPDGRLVLMGVDAENPLIVTPDLLMKRGQIIGSLQNDRECLYEALDYVARGKVKVLTEVYRLADIARAYDRVAAGSVRFRAVIVP